MSSDEPPRVEKGKVVVLPSDAAEASSLFEELGEKIRSGGLVAFPTETVYGLGANALNKTAVLSIFTTKGRPLSDPVICHVAKRDDALSLLDISEEEKALFIVLTDAFWPGPLSLVGRASKIVPPVVTASSGFVAVRNPVSLLARRLIESAGVPVAAPSANAFGRISPTTASHVWKNFAEHPVTVLDGGPCPVGIESSVVRLELASPAETGVDGGKSSGPPRLLLSVLRRGAVTADMLSKAVSDAASRLPEGSAERAVLETVEVCVSAKIEYTMNPQTEKEQTSYISPGMMLSHYSPKVPTYFVTEAEGQAGGDDSSRKVGGQAGDGERAASVPTLDPSECLLIDLGTESGSRLSSLFGANLKMDFASSSSSPPPSGGTGETGGSPSASSAAVASSGDDDTETERLEKVAASLFATLHDAEEQAQRGGLKAILITHLGESDLQGVGEKGLAIYDKLYRACSGRMMTLFQLPDAGGSGGEEGENSEAFQRKKRALLSLDVP
uniref:Threonylcarbamoyl-AMP synthase n=1 Tax=Chromera velia CCMP2878 TaxID=1169474 RepID=A0A0G4HTF5_9ALVE|eukprot:Cvel_8448.t1-p1 / transcript=Cvel_8448.t1 / gene=Cvel_8448 / organism=Chromera_velia_CCMP2878 / gene_product=tRNA threonylcarbamoyladenosine biosynthesis, putative / transcript_product=tRNA threonylcarbamoyladenosine biosynthesis, putative / location=Cvel_scaffold466:70571-72906(+) / protein_length=499 / sequence_SO=supercontig / SO=protein_coding / is_pseudo=false